jgi:hypothetical protein
MSPAGGNRIIRKVAATCAQKDCNDSPSGRLPKVFCTSVVLTASPLGDREGEQGELCLRLP